MLKVEYKYIDVEEYIVFFLVFMLGMANGLGRITEEESDQILIILILAYVFVKSYIAIECLKAIYDSYKSAKEINHNINQLEQVMGYGRKPTMYPPLDAEDIKKISLYIPFGVTFGDITLANIESFHFVPEGIMGSKIIRSSKNVISVDECPDLTSHGNSMRPILRRLIEMTDEQLWELEKLTSFHPGGEYPHVNMAENLFSNGFDFEVFLYCLSQHLDIYELIFHDKAINFSDIN